MVGLVVGGSVPPSSGGCVVVVDVELLFYTVQTGESIRVFTKMLFA